MIFHPEDLECPECGNRTIETELPEREYMGFTCESCDWYEVKKKDLPSA